MARSSSPAPSERVRVRRAPARADYDRPTIDAIIDEAMVAHLGFAVDGQPYVIPTLHARVGDEVYIHGSTASRMVKTTGAGVPACLTVTLIDGLVLARSAFNHSMNYRSAVVLGEARMVEGDDERMAALEAFTERLIPGRWAECRPPSRQELKGTQVLALHLDESSAKVRDGGPKDEPDDHELDHWAGVIPLRTTPGALEPDTQLRSGIPVPESVIDWTAAHRS
jgi:nitroimidazol reductase NimA-like FMN-containing flavoprotein (pyridoxamine 5'-phosphate oxidase superfamily)